MTHVTSWRTRLLVSIVPAAIACSASVQAQTFKPIAPLVFTKTFGGANPDHAFGAGDQAFVFGGVPGDIPFTGDWDGSGTTKIGVFRAGYLWVLDTNGNHTFDAETRFSRSVEFPEMCRWSGTGTEMDAPRSVSSAPGSSGCWMSTATTSLVPVTRPSPSAVFAVTCPSPASGDPVCAAFTLREGLSGQLYRARLFQPRPAPSLPPPRLPTRPRNRHNTPSLPLPASPRAENPRPVEARHGDGPLSARGSLPNASSPP